MSRLMTLALAVGVFWVTAHLPAQERSFPRTRQMGRATVEYKDEILQIVASYDYSQRYHSSNWLLIDVAAWTKRRLILERDNITLVTPSGGQTMVAAQRRFLLDSPNISSLRQNAKIWRRELNIYLSPYAPRESLKFFALPGEGIIADTALLDKDRVTAGEVYFEMPLGGWEAGTYALVIDHPSARATLPVTLE
jgi:hypothetical protein